MKHELLTRALGCAAGATLALAAATTAAADFPTKPITLVVCYAPGGMGDVFARIVAERLSLAVKQPVLVENKPGATGAIGARYVAKSAPDGYTLLLGQTGEIVINRVAMKQPGYDALRELRPVTLVGDAALAMITSSASPYGSVRELVASMAQKGAQLSYASSGTGTPGHLAAAAFNIGMKVDAVHVPYKGAGAAMNDVLGRQVAYFFSSAPAAMPLIKGGKLKALAVSSAERVAALPDVPTVAESGLPGFSFSLWGGVFAPAQTPDDVVALLGREINRIITDPATRARIEGQGAVVRANTPDEFAEFVRREAAKYADIVRQTGASFE